jgi:2-keto-3-deoxy-L-rhamnonate aldolase RhmA
MDYLKQANDNILVITQVETREAYENIAELCAVDGLGQKYLMEAMTRVCTHIPSIL